MSGGGVRRAVRQSHSDLEADRNGDLDQAVTGEGVAPVFQPIVSLPTGTTVGFEALARWPRQPHLLPQSVFAYAAETDQVTQLDRLCIDRAVDGALRAGLTQGALLGVNSEPASDYTGRAESEILERGYGKFALVFELTERNLLSHLPTLLRKVAALRADGIAIALDDVGANPESLALLDIVCPEVIKLDNKLIQGRPSADTAKTEAAISAHRERRGTLIIAEGIETDRHFEHALAWGATLGQGFRFGRPGPLPAARTAAWSPPVVPACAGRPLASPFDMVAEDQAIQTAPKKTLRAISRYIEDQAQNSTDASMVLTAVQDARHFGPFTRERYAKLAEVCPLVMVFGHGLAADQGAGVRVVSLEASDPLCAQRIVLSLGPHTAVALVSRERATEDAELADDDRQFDFVVTHDRSVITAAASALLNRMP